MRLGLSVKPTKGRNEMQKYIKMLLTVVLAFAIILSMATGVLATEQEHVHNWVLQEGGLRGHTLKCDGCGQTKFEDHTVDSSEICTVCGVYYHTHNWQCAWSDDQMHNMVCSGCGEEKTTTHSKDSEGVCTVCGYTPHEHIWQYNGEYSGYSHGLRCTQCAATSMEDHIYGNDGKCTVCGQAPPHEHQWEWDGNKSNYLYIHFMVCSCGATTSDHHQLAWYGIRTDRWHTMVCNVCGYTASYTHDFSPAFFNGERCLVCGYQVQGATESETKPSEMIPEETGPAETEPVETTPAETTPVETESAETLTKETESSGTKPDETESAESEPTDMKLTPSETMPKNAAKEDSQRSSSVWVWVTAVIVVAGGLGTVVFFLKKKLS